MTWSEFFQKFSFKTTRSLQGPISEKIDHTVLFACLLTVYIKPPGFEKVSTKRLVLPFFQILEA
jgi:hypothetical protein